MRLVNGVSGIAANNTDLTTNPPVPNPALIYVNPDPVFVERALLQTLYFWADPTVGVWDTAEIQLFISPQIINSNPPLNPVPAGTTQIVPVWFPLLDSAGNPITATANKYVNFQARWGMIKAVVTNASANTASIYCSLFEQC